MTKKVLLMLALCLATASSAQSQQCIPAETTALIQELTTQKSDQSTQVARLLTNEGDAYRLKNQHTCAIRAYRLALGYVPEDYVALHGLAIVLKKTDHKKEALRFFYRALEAACVDRNATYAEKIFSDCIELNSPLDKFLDKSRRSRLLISAGAESDLVQGEIANGWVSITAQDYEKAERSFRVALRIFPDSFGARLGLIIIQDARKQWREASEEYEALLKKYEKKIKDPDQETRRQQWLNDIQYYGRTFYWRIGRTRESEEFDKRAEKARNE